MLPLSEADPEVHAEVAQILGRCKCSNKYKSRWTGHASDPRDPRCAYHACGEAVADLVRQLRLAKKRIKSLIELGRELTLNRYSEER